MNLSRTFSFRKKKKKQPALEILKTLSLISNAALAVNRSLKEKIKEQEYLLIKQKKQPKNDTNYIVAGVIGGLVAIVVAAFFLFPETGDNIKERLSEFLEEDEPDFEETLTEARQKAKDSLSLNGGS